MNENIVVPVLGESITEATVSKWLKKSGDKVKADEPIVELETDKVNLEVPSPINGILSEIKTKEGETVEVGALLGVISDGEKEASQVIDNRKKVEKNKNVVSFERNKISYIGREPAASPATGYAKRHLAQQKEILDKVFK